ncbi:MAG: glycosyltransferase [Chloroflexota bacterium]
MGVPNVLIWHIHGSYLNYVVRAAANFYLPVKPGRPEGYGGKGRTFRWPENVHEVPAEEVKRLDLDLVIHQTPKNYLEDQYEILSEAQRGLPIIYLEHNTPKGHPTDTRHLVDDPNVLLVHVTHFNRMMWDSGRSPTLVIEHGVALDEEVRYQGDLDRGIVVVNGMARRKRIAGFDVWDQMWPRVPLELAGMGSEELGGLGDIPHTDLLQLEARYRFFFNPIRYTSLPLALVEAMAIGMPIVALATTEVPAVVENGISGYVSNDLDFLAEGMLHLLSDRREATKMGRRSQEIYRERFSMERFCRDWEEAFALVTGNPRAATDGRGE